MTKKVITLEELKKNNNAENCWIVISGKVYDVSKFLKEHPGGEEVMSELAGQDATDGFNDVGHSKDAQEMAKEYLIGTLESTVKVTSEPVLKQQNVSLSDIILSPTWTNFLIPSAIGIVVYIVYKLIFGQFSK